MMASRSLMEVDLAALAHNVTVLRGLAPDSLFCVVVKAEGYGHGAVEVAGAALDAGANWLAVAQVAEARLLRRAGIDAPLMLLSEPTPDELVGVIDLDCRVVVYRTEAVEALDDLVRERGAPAVKAHLMVDTGMQRVGCRPDESVELAMQISDARGLEFEGLLTHLAVADESTAGTTEQLDRFAEVEERIAAADLHPAIVHVANSAGLIDHPSARRDLVRVGIAAYGVLPGADVGDDLDLRPAMTFRTQVTFVKDVVAGSQVSYGLRHTFNEDTRVATLPVGYADGVPRALGLAGAEVLIGGTRHPMVGVVTMDQLMVEVGSHDVAPGDEVVLLGAQGDERVRPEEWAELTGTIGYEIVCNAGRRAQRLWIRPA